MAKSAMTPAKAADTEVTELRRGPPAELAGMVEEDAGKGVSTRQEDNIVPMIYILQAQSPQCMRGQPAYIPGAGAGMLWLKGQEDEDAFVDGEDGALFQPCSFWTNYVEWVPRDEGGGGGQGYVAQHDLLEGETEEQLLARLNIVERDDPKNPGGRKLWGFRDNNHILIHTRYHAGYVVAWHDLPPLPFVIPFSSTGHTVSREWMMKMNNQFVKNSKGVMVKAPSWAKLYRLRTKMRTNKVGSWYQMTVADGGWVQTADDYERGRALHMAFASGEKTAEAPQQNTAGAGTSEEVDVPF